MKNLMIFLFGAVCGAGGTLLWLRKDIKKRLDETNMATVTMADDDVPFTVGDEDKNKEAVKAETWVAYNNIIKNTEEKNDLDLNSESSDETDGGIYEIDADEFMHDHSNEKERLVYYRGDKIMSTETGVIISNPFMLVGGEWETCVGNYADRTAFIRNPRLVTDYEIFVEDGLYSDEFGVMDYRED